MSEFNIEIDKVQLKKLEKTLSKLSLIESELSKAMDGVAHRGLVIAVDNTPKRTGRGRDSWKMQRRGKLGRVITSDYRPLRAVNDGVRKSVIIRPIRGKYLLFGIEDRALTETRAQVKKSAKDAYWNAVSRHRRIKTSNPFQAATRETGVVAARKVRTKPRAGTKFIQKLIVPKIQKDMFRTIEKVIDKGIK